MQPENNPEQSTRWDARQLATMSLFIAMGALLAFIPIPIWPLAAGFGITYDPANVPAIIGGLAFGPGGGLVIGILSAIVHGILASDMVGTGMNIVAVIGCVIPCALIYRSKKTTMNLIIGLIVGSLVSVALIIPANLFVWPYFYHIPLNATLGYVVPLMLPFNLLKAVANSVLSFVLYKSLRKLLEK